MNPIQKLSYFWGEQIWNLLLKTPLSEVTDIVLIGLLEEWNYREVLSLDHKEKIKVKLPAHHWIQHHHLKKVADYLQMRNYCLQWQNIIEIVAKIRIITTFIAFPFPSQFFFRIGWRIFESNVFSSMLAMLDLMSSSLSLRFFVIILFKQLFFVSSESLLRIGLLEKSLLW